MTQVQRTKAIYCKPLAYCSPTVYIDRHFALNCIYKFYKYTKPVTCILHRKYYTKALICLLIDFKVVPLQLPISSDVVKTKVSTLKPKAWTLETKATGQGINPQAQSLDPRDQGQAASSLRLKTKSRHKIDTSTKNESNILQASSIL